MALKLTGENDDDAAKLDLIEILFVVYGRKAGVVESCSAGFFGHSFLGMQGPRSAKNGTSVLTSVRLAAHIRRLSEAVDKVEMGMRVVQLGLGGSSFVAARRAHQYHLMANCCNKWNDLVRSPNAVSSLQENAEWCR